MLRLSAAKLNGVLDLLLPTLRIRRDDGGLVVIKKLGTTDGEMPSLVTLSERGTRQD